MWQIENLSISSIILGVKKILSRLKVNFGLTGGSNTDSLL